MSRYLLKLYKDVLRNASTQLSPVSKYILSLVNHSSFSQEKCLARSLEDFHDATIILSAFQHRAARLIYELAQVEMAGVPWSDLNLECMRLSKVPAEAGSQPLVAMPDPFHIDDTNSVIVRIATLLGARSIHHDRELLQRS